MSSRAAISLIQSKSSAETLLLRCHVRPGASKAREGVVAITDEVIELCVSAPPQDGKANKAVLAVLSEALDMPKSDLQITHGLKSRDKTVSVLSGSLGEKWLRDATDIIKSVREKLDSAASSRNDK
ncbi:DUF167-domain-containing protein [Xylaria bambusicola]|uniref:DUF167-domain-containing protein n=1 Tax=Xylaria bambusicola TaxID=326684 RepID=UPI0020087027|nr:DUF167-domain-containing protein [Xylaria bambusicola]KAI0517832.1 DUF167-domain-containing protein [Xylaria bambusicola]